MKKLLLIGFCLIVCYQSISQTAFTISTEGIRMQFFGKDGYLTKRSSYTDVKKLCGCGCRNTETYREKKLADHSWFKVAYDSSTQLIQELLVDFSECKVNIYYEYETATTYTGGTTPFNTLEELRVIPSIKLDETNKGSIYIPFTLGNVKGEFETEYDWKLKKTMIRRMFVYFD